MSCYIKNILKICLDKLDLHVVSVIYHQMIKDWEALIFPENSKTTKFFHLMTSLLGWVTIYNHNRKNA